MDSSDIAVRSSSVSARNAQAITDGSPEDAFNVIAQLAADYLNAPMALISLMDGDRQWFKANVGLSISELGGDGLFHAQAVAHDDILVVPDARNDPRFRDDPAVAGAPAIRFLAGAPLKALSGDRLGMLYVMDRKPRTGLSEEQRHFVARLSTLVVRELDFRHTLQIREKTEAELRRARDSAERVSQAKSMVYANISHEVRTPLNAIVGLLYLLQRTELLPHQADLVRKMGVACKNLLSLVNGVLDSVSLELNTINIEAMPFNLLDVVKDVATLSQAAIGSNPVSFSVDVARDVPPFVVGDTQRLHQILTNLISNAIKFTEQGEIKLAIEVSDRNAAAINLRFSVIDSGPGIAAGELDAIFEPFRQADSSITRRHGGTGLGLSIVRDLVGVMGGRVGVESTLGQGSTFWFDLPFERCRPEDLVLPVASAAFPASDRLRGLRILLVDDSDINLEVGRNILSFEGARVECAVNGQDAVDAVLASPAFYDVVLMDLQMPVLDGYDAFERMTSILREACPPVLALTAGAHRGGDSQRPDGMAGVVTKPFIVDNLVETILKCVNRRQAASAPKSRLAEVVTERDWPSLPRVDRQAAMERMAGNLALYLDLLGRMLVEFRGIAQADRLQGGTQIAGALHRLKSNAGLLGMLEVSELALMAEQSIDAGCDEDLERYLVELDLEMTSVRNALETYNSRHADTDVPN